ncbi:SDR family oxidoreductase [Jatrophihabitans endophyticus]|uniref:SDR family oxidoreductase n=1 Tax=Jatrophihabitans endophyticus TaxID=1206085 RepID=UPI0019F3FF78|nr:SDR family oxidoreductase [Jatrophihabitans endophyticus]MBE7187798.1 SDR family oxidoreductase [Jatrophihabitans endophyticus]
MAKNWFITGTSRGFGRLWAQAALERGDKVAATARSVDSLAELVETHGDNVLPIALDVTDHDAVFAAVRQAHDAFGNLDVVVNNAGYGHFGMIEEVTEQELRSQMEANFFGTFWVTQAALPYLRERGSGHIIQVSSIGGITAFPTIGAYHASKWAVEAFTQSLAAEVAQFGVHVTAVEPGGYATDWAGASAKTSEPIHAYDALRQAVRDDRATEELGHPEATAAVLLKLVDSPEPPTRIFFGSTPLPIAKTDYESRLATWEKWNDLAVEARG